MFFQQITFIFILCTCKFSYYYPSNSLIQDFCYSKFFKAIGNTKTYASARIETTQSNAHNQPLLLAINKTGSNMYRDLVGIN